jgi:protein kinase A
VPVCPYVLTLFGIFWFSISTAKYVKEKTYTLCGTPLYIAPEVVLNRGHDMGADHWSLACMIFEMICGATPFYKDGMDQLSLFRAVVKGRFKFPRSRREIFSEEFQGSYYSNAGRRSASATWDRWLVAKRISSVPRGSRKLSFDKLKRKELKAPWVPEIKDPLDTSNFENSDHLDDKAKAKDPPISAKDDEIFKDF